MNVLACRIYTTEGAHRLDYTAHRLDYTAHRLDYTAHRLD